ncbi:GntR family transcriptional regulator [Sediminispirochaeta smaragdinae]|uniref:GntR family transcriptional regulator n=1 Tax=Sediminispirochaeta smaragdinae TaxID=55206 RepID=UPI00031F63D9|nr:GntR family transcriptional regulator [Sediminispirochaeta smaragdinae]
MKLSRIPSRKPLYQEVQEEILSLIRDWDEERPIPSEAVLSEQFGVSRSTVREALQRLENADVVYKRHGVGTFVRPQSNAIATAMNYLHGIERIIRSSGKEPSFGRHEVSVITFDEHIREVFSDERVKRGVRVVRVYLADGTPTLYAVSYIPETILDGDLESAAEKIERLGRAGESLFSILAAAFQHSVDYAVTRIRAVMPSDAIFAELNFSQSEPCIKLNQIHHDRDGRVLIYSEDVLDPEVFELIVLRKSIR